MYSRPALPNICGAGGAAVNPRFSFIFSNVHCIGIARSMYLMPSEPFSIFSKPSASAQSARPPSTKLFARYSAEEPVAQLLLTFTTGMPVTPISYSARWPAVESP